MTLFHLDGGYSDLQQTAASRTEICGFSRRARCQKILYVHLTIEDALSLLDIWKAHRTLLLVHFSTPGASRDLQMTVKDLNGTTVRLAAASEEIQVDLTGGEFNGDRRGPTNSKLHAFLVCELRNDRWAFYATREG